MIVAKLDRLTRSLKDLSVLIEQYFKRWLLVSCHERIDTGSATGLMMLNLLTTVSQWERDIISERTKAAVATKRKKGLAHGNPPYGWQVTEDKRLEPNLTEQTIISTVKNLANAGYTQRRIRDELFKLGYRTRRRVGKDGNTRGGRPISHSTIAEILLKADREVIEEHRRRREG